MADDGELRRRCVAAMAVEERDFRPDMEGLRIFFAGAGTMNQGQREHVVQFITEVCEDYGFAGQTAWTAVNFFDRYLAKAVQTPKRRIELISLSCLLIAAKYLECRSPSLEDLRTLSQNRLSKQDLMSAELKILEALQWELAVPSPHAFLFHLVHIMATYPYGDVFAENVNLILKRAEFFVDLSAFEYSFLTISFGTVAGAALICALRQLRLDSAIETTSLVELELCSVLDCEQAVLATTAEKLMSCYHSCVAAEEEQEALPPNSAAVFEPIKEGVDPELPDPRSESPDSVMTTAAMTKPPEAAAKRGKSKVAAPMGRSTVPSSSTPEGLSVSEAFRGRTAQQERSKRSRTS